MEERMWDELNRILGGNRKEGLSAGKEVQDRGAPLPEKAPTAPAGATPTESKNEALPSNDEQLGECENLPSSGDLVDESDGRNILEEASGLVPPPAGGQEELPRSGAASAAEDMAPPPAPVFSFSQPPRSKPAGRRLVKPDLSKAPTHTPEERLLLLDCWQRSNLPAKDFAALVGVSKHTLYAWKKAFAQHGPAGLMEKKRGAKEGSRLPELTKRTILMLKQANPDWGCERISAMLARGPALPASPGAVSRVLHEAGYEMEEAPTRPHPDKVRFFERAQPNQLWQTDLFTFMLKRQNRRVYLVAFLDDHSRFIVSFGLHASQSTALVLEVLRAGIASYGAPREVLTDNGAQYITWRGKSAFTKELEKRGIQQIVSRPRHPQTLGKIERFWGTLWRECLEAAVFIDLADARARIGHFIDWYNFHRQHSGVDYLAPADRFFGAAPDVLRTLRERVAANALELARNGVPRPPFYMTGQVGGKNFSLHAEGERVFLTREGEPRREVELAAPPQSVPEQVLPAPLCPDGSPAGEETGEGMDGDGPAPGTSPLDQFWPPHSSGDEASADQGGDSDIGGSEGGAP
jgi:transposase InsO family protein